MDLRNTSALLVLTGLLASPALAGTQVSREDRIDAALGKAARFLVGKQSPDGAWRSGTYGCFREGPELTPNIMNALFFLPQGGERARSAYRKGVAYLAGMVGPDGSIRAGPGKLLFPVYTAAASSWIIVKEKQTPAFLKAQAAWLAFLRKRQLNETLGWAPADPEYGGFGFSLDPPVKPAPGEQREAFFESNLSATVYAIGAFAAAKVPREDPAFSKALAFVQRCQNFPDESSQADPRFDDGGFFFIPTDPLQNKAGVAGEDESGRERYHSYGTMTGDGLRALLQCGLGPGHPRVVAARRWLEKQFTAKTNPGDFDERREVLRDATYYYYAWSVAHAFARLGLTEAETATGKVRWAETLADELLARQRPDGSWVNRFTDAKEDDPLVSTPWAASALAICRQVIAGGKPG